jgi:hypothetical protein
VEKTMNRKNSSMLKIFVVFVLTAALSIVARSAAAGEEAQQPLHHRFLSRGRGSA